MSILNRINIKEVDETSAGSAVVNRDVVFVPGLSAINNRAFIVDIAGKTPADAAYTHTDTSVETTFYNRVDKKTWIWTADTYNVAGGYWKVQTVVEQTAEVTGLEGTEATTLTVDAIKGIETAVEIFTIVVTDDAGVSREVTWTSVNTETGVITLTSALSATDVSAVVSFGYGGYTYVAPTKENTPVLCESLAAFNAAFGTTPVQFDANQAYVDFSAAATSGIQYLAQVGDYEKGYVYAKELLFVGLPVLYTNIVIRDPLGRITKAVAAADVSKVQPYEGIPVNGTVAAIYAAFTGYTYEDTSTRVYQETSDETPVAGKNYFTKDGNDYIKFSGSEFASGTTYYEVKTAGEIHTVDSIFDILEDKGEYVVKYITSGGYPTYEYKDNAVVVKMLAVAANRGDATAYIDHTNNPVRALTSTNSVDFMLNDSTSTYRITGNGEFGTMLTPWAFYTCSTISGTQVMPASFGYFLALGQSIRTNANYLAIAGVSRGIVPHITAENTLSVLSNKIADSYQSKDATNMNAITNVKPYGLTIWGNRTLKNNAVAGNLTATSFLNIRNMVSDIKKVVYDSAKSLLFEQNTDILWLNFCSMIQPTLNSMNAGAGVSGYKILKGETTEKGKIVATIRIYPVYAVEEFDITIVISDEEVSVS